MDFLHRIRLLSGQSRPASTAGEVIGDLALLTDELRVRRDEASSYKAQLALL